MARFVGKTFESLNSMLSNTGFFLSNQEKGSSKFLSCPVDSKSFIRKLKNVESKQAEEDIIKLYSAAIEKRLSEPDVPNAEIDEMIKMCMTCEIMGYSTDFVYVHCLKLAQKGNLQEKHTGYSAASFFLHPHHELVILLINTIQKDLHSSNYMEVLFALSSVCNLITSETVQNVLYLVEEKLNHERSSVRKAAILTFSHCLHLTNSQSAFQMSIPKLERALTDKELEVVAAAVSTIYKIIQKLSCDFTYLITSLVELQEQILLRRVPRSMVYCDIPAPWLQLDILKILNVLCNGPDQYIEVTPILKKTLQQVGLQNTLSHAIMYQLIEIITHVEPSNELVELILSSVSLFLKSKNTNLKLTGVEALVLVVQRLKPSITVAQQEIIMECLKLPDETLQLKTLELLFHLANPSNVQAICKKLMEFLIKSTNADKKKELALKVLQLATLFMDRQEWFVSITTSILTEAGELLPPSDIYNTIDTISKDPTLKEMTKNLCLKMCSNGENFSPCLLKLSASVLSTSSEFEEFLLKKFPITDEEATTWVLISLFDVIVKTKEISSSFVNFLKKLEVPFESSSQVLCQMLHVIEAISNLQDFNFSEEIDPTLTFLDNFVLQALENSEPCYLPSSFRLTSMSIIKTSEEIEPEFFTSIEAPFAQDSSNSSPHKSLAYSEFSSPSTSFQSLTCDKDICAPVMPRTKSIWTEEGRKSISNNEERLPGDNKETPPREEPNEDFKDLFAGIS